ncbi:hypothetical protein [Dubosiella newyorkensis]|uniref:Uncharacterized protein n=1 Tax=Dubosiella newyorkensis TaxID=1862672 RepID=A0A1U7NMS3_9FIRM|nr:hypothetical protein [Dubosiella newyorkensis]OLU46592.1 hypothetical protein BO225_05320 [Dubosiella newyorkensis]
MTRYLPRLFTILFIGMFALKTFFGFDLSWWIVFSPLYLPFVIVFSLAFQKALLELFEENKL